MPGLLLRTLFLTFKKTATLSLRVVAVAGEHCGVKAIVRLAGA